MKCSLCKIEMKRYTSKNIEKMHKEDSKFFGVKYKKGVLACPVHYKLKKGEFWLKL